MLGQLRWSRPFRGFAILVLGFILGSMFVPPVRAHFTKTTRHLGAHAWAEFIRDRVYTRRQVNNRFYDKSQANDRFAHRFHTHDFTGSVQLVEGGLVGFPWNDRIDVISASVPPDRYDAAYRVSFQALAPFTAASGSISCDLRTRVGFGEPDGSRSDGDPLGLADSATASTDGFVTLEGESPMGFLDANRPLHQGGFFGVSCLNTMEDSAGEPITLGLFVRNLRVTRLSDGQDFSPFR